MTEKRLKILYVVVLLLIPLAFFMVSNSIRTEMYSLESSLKNVKKEIAVYSRQNSETSEKIRIYKKILALFQTDKLSVPENAVELFSIVQKELTSNGVLSRVIDQTGARRKSLQGETDVKISFEGPYQSFIRTLADWRRLKIALRVKSAVINNYKENMVRGDLVLSAVVGK